MLKNRLLIADQEGTSRALMEEFLKDDFSILTAPDGESVVHLSKLHQPDIVLMDVELPKMDGIAVCDRLRNDESTRHIQVVLFSPLDDAQQRATAFLRGADDFLVEPFSKEELQARLLSKLRRIRELSGEGPILACGNLVLDEQRLETRINDTVVPLSVLEFRLLSYFVLRKNKVLSRSTILETVWKDSVVSSRTVDTHIACLRKKIKESEFQIFTVYSAGYILKKAHF